MNVKKLFLYLFIASVSISAVIGIVVILFGTFGELESKILLTTTTVTCASILGLACGAYFETSRGKILPMAGIGLAVISAMLWIAVIWEGIGTGEFLIKAIGTLTILAVSCSHLSLISIARLAPRFIWSRYVAFVCVWLLTAIVLWLIWFDPMNNSDLVQRTNGILSIIIAAVTITTPVFHRLSRHDDDEKEIDEEIEELKKRLAELEQRKAEIRG